VGVPLPGQGQSSSPTATGKTAQTHPGPQLEGAGPPVQTVSKPHGSRQECQPGRGGYCARIGGLYVGHCPGNSPPGVDTAWRSFFHAEGNQVGNVDRKRRSPGVVQSSLALSGSKKPACLDPGRCATDPSKVVPNPRISA